METTLTIQQVAEATGLTTHTLRYYERAGLLEGVGRNGGGHRRYTERDIDVLTFLQRLRMTGMPIHMVRHYAELARAGSDTIDERRQLLEDHRQAVLDEIALLQSNLAVLDYKIDLYKSGWTPGQGSDPCLCELRRLCGIALPADKAKQTA